MRTLQLSGQAPEEEGPGRRTGAKVSAQARPSPMEF